MEKINLAEILQNVPLGTKLYSPIFGECEFQKVENGIIHTQTIRGVIETFFEDGTYYREYECGECMLFPSKEEHNWANFKVERYKVGDHIFHIDTKEVYFLTRKSQSRDGFWAKRINSHTDDCEVFISNEDLAADYVGIIKFNPRWLKEFDRVIIRVTTESIWYATSFSHLTGDCNYPYLISDGCRYKYCVPYNEETKHLIRTTEEEPEFYKKEEEV